MSAVAVDRPRAVAPIVDGLFIATVATVTLAKLQWEVAGTLSFSDIVTALFLIAFLVRGSSAAIAGSPAALRSSARVLRSRSSSSTSIGFFNLETSQALGQWAKGMVKFVLHFLFLVAGASR